MEERNRVKCFRKWLVRIGVILLVVVIVLAGAGVWLVHRPWPQVSGEIKVAGLLAPVKVIRDRWGVPNIYAENEHDLFFTQGYVHAQDRLWQMEMNRRIANGTLSAAIGEPMLPVDQLLRTLGLRRVAEQSWPRLDDDSRVVLEAYAEGVNAYIETHRDRLPLEFTILKVDPDPWTPIDSLAWGNLMVFNMTHHSRNEIEYAKAISALGETTAQELFAFTLGLPSGNLSMTVPSEVKSYDWLQHSNLEGRLAALGDWLGNSDLDWGSNNWVVHGSRTMTGEPLLANDTHVSFQMPSFWYENGLHGGRFDGLGFTFPGTPSIVIGHNQHIAWGITNLPSDNQDNYLEKLDNLDNPTSYEFMGEWHDLEFIQETIEVKGGEAVTFNIPFTSHGPIVNMGSVSESGDEQPVALRWTLYEGNMIFKSILLVNLARDWDEFRAALQYWDAPAQHFVYADVEGNIGYQATGKTPIRVPEHLGILPMPGWTGSYEWQGFIPFDELPTAFNPPEGFVVTANNKVIPDDYPYSLGYGSWHPGLRVKRIVDLLSGDDLTREDMQFIQGQTYLPSAEATLPYLLAVEPDDDLQAEALARLEAWDLYHDTDSVGASVYEVWYMFIVINTIGDEWEEFEHERWLGERETLRHFQHELFLIKLLADTESVWFDNVDTPEVEDCGDVLHHSLADAIGWLSERFGDDPDDWEWGRVHTIAFVHMPLGQSGIPLLENLFNSKTLPAPGDFRTVNQARYGWEDDEGFKVTYGSAQRMIVDLSDWDSMSMVNSTGQSGHLFHPHRADQIQMWRNVEYHSLPFTRDAVENSAKATLNLLPK